MSIRSKYVVVFAVGVLGFPACVPSDDANSTAFEPREVIDLGTVVTEDLPERVWGRAILEQFAPLGFDRQNTFAVVEWELGAGEDLFSGQNSYYEFFNHGGPHVDAPKHVSLGGGLDSYPVEVFSGPATVFDARQYRNGRSIPVELFEGLVSAGDVVLVHCGYVPPQTDDETPEFATLTPAAAEYLANVPIKAYGTDAMSVDPLDATPVQAESVTGRAIPIHHAFLSRAIPIYEELFNMDRLIDRPETDGLYFTGVPLSIEDGDGMLVRPVVFVY
jgi:kynurenine formamidase